MSDRSLAESSISSRKEDDPRLCTSRLSLANGQSEEIPAVVDVATALDYDRITWGLRRMKVFHEPRTRLPDLDLRVVGLAVTIGGVVWRARETYLGERRWLEEDHGGWASVRFPESLSESTIFDPGGDVSAESLSHTYEDYLHNNAETEPPTSMRLRKSTPRGSPQANAGEILHLGLAVISCQLLPTAIEVRHPTWTNNYGHVLKDQLESYLEAATVE
jgi:hypothetical protein